MSPFHSFSGCLKLQFEPILRLTIILLTLLTTTLCGLAAKAQSVPVYEITFQSGPNKIVGYFRGATIAGAEDFSVKEYNEFHRVLHPLEHEALPKNDMATIRRRASELIKLGEAIVKLGVPTGTKSEYVEDFKKELEKFKTALTKYGTDAESGSDTDLKKSYSAVHDSFEELAGMLPRK